MALYTSNWYGAEFDRNFKKSMVFFMMKTARPITFRPGNFFTLSLEMFVSVSSLKNPKVVENYFIKNIFIVDPTIIVYIFCITAKSSQ